MNIPTLPKIELHRHIEGAIRYETMKEWVLSDDLMPASTPEEVLRDFILIAKPVDGLKVFLEKFGLIHRVLSSPERIRRMAFEACEDAWRDGIRLLELRYSPIFIQGERTDLSFDTILAAMMEGIQAAQKVYPLPVGLIGILGREWDVPTATRVTDFFIANRGAILAMDLANDEANFSCKPFAPLYQKARNAGLRLTAHAGESDIPTSSDSIRRALDELGAERLGHGVQIYKDPVLMDEVARRGILLELCPSSNVRTRCIQKIEDYPLRAIRKAGVRVCLNADDPGVFDYSLSHEWSLMAEHHGQTESDFRAMNRDALAASFLPEAEKAKAQKNLDPQ